jgi:hypothetical protein
MSKLPLDDATLAKFRKVKERIEVCDEQGRIAGYFEPSIYAGVVMPPDPTDEELAAEETYTFDEVLAHLKSLERR